jgi:ferredoxin
VARAGQEISSQGNEVRVRVDSDKCQGHNRCVATCPEVFSTDDLGYAVLLQEKVPRDLAPKVFAAEANCPEQAISVQSSG